MAHNRERVMYMPPVCISLSKRGNKRTSEEAETLLHWEQMSK